MKGPRTDSELLARLIAEERERPLPQRDWERIEAGIDARLAQPVAPARSRSPVAPYAGLAAAAAIALGLLAVGRSEPVATAANPARPPAVLPEKSLKGDEITPGRQLSAPAAQAMHVEHAGRAHWTLEPGSNARVRHDGEVIVIELDHGTVNAEVEPSRVPESFVVEAGDVRVAVHGTKFGVHRHGSAVDVSVSEGVVSVASKLSSQPVRLVAPASRNFTSAAPASSAPPAHARAAASAPPPSPVLPEEPRISDIEASVSRIQDAAQSCFTRHTSAADGVEVSARSSVLLSVRPDGSVSASFDPPLAPNVDACTRAALGKIRFPPSRRGIELTRTLDLRL